MQSLLGLLGLPIEDVSLGATQRVAAIDLEPAASDLLVKRKGQKIILVCRCVSYDDYCLY